MGRNMASGRERFSIARAEMAKMWQIKMRGSARSGGFCGNYAGKVNGQQAWRNNARAITCIYRGMRMAAVRIRCFVAGNQITSRPKRQSFWHFCANRPQLCFSNIRSRYLFRGVWLTTLRLEPNSFARCDHEICKTTRLGVPRSTECAASLNALFRTNS